MDKDQRLLYCKSFKLHTVKLIEKIKGNFENRSNEL